MALSESIVKAFEKRGHFELWESVDGSFVSFGFVFVSHRGALFVDGSRNPRVEAKARINFLIRSLFDQFLGKMSLPNNWFQDRVTKFLATWIHQAFGLQRPLLQRIARSESFMNAQVLTSTSVSSKRGKSATSGLGDMWDIVRLHDTREQLIMNLINDS